MFTLIKFAVPVQQSPDPARLVATISFFTEYEMNLTASERLALISQYADGYDAVMTAIADITEAELDSREAPGEWSTRQIIHHLCDVELNVTTRLRVLLADREPAIRGFDQDLWSDVLFTNERPIEPSLQAFRWAREATLPILRMISGKQWERTGTHSEEVTITVDDWLRLYCPHAHGHLDQIRRARAAATG